MITQNDVPNINQLKAIAEAGADSIEVVTASVADLTQDVLRNRERAGDLSSLKTVVKFIDEEVECSLATAYFYISAQRWTGDHIRAVPMDVALYPKGSEGIYALSVRLDMFTEEERSQMHDLLTETQKGTHALIQSERAQSETIIEHEPPTHIAVVQNAGAGPLTLDDIKRVPIPGVCPVVDGLHRISGRITESPFLNLPEGEDITRELFRAVFNASHDHVRFVIQDVEQEYNEISTVKNNSLPLIVPAAVQQVLNRRISAQYRPQMTMYSHEHVTMLEVTDDMFTAAYYVSNDVYCQKALENANRINPEIGAIGVPQVGGILTAPAGYNPTEDEEVDDLELINANTRGAVDEVPEQEPDFEAEGTKSTEGAVTDLAEEGVDLSGIIPLDGDMSDINIDVADNWIDWLAQRGFEQEQDKGWTVYSGALNGIEYVLRGETPTSLTQVNPGPVNLSVQYENGERDKPHFFNTEDMITYIENNTQPGHQVAMG